MISLRSAKWDDVRHIAKHMRQSDREELDAVGIHNPGGALVAGMENSSICLSIHSNQYGPVAMLGVIGNIDEPANVWLLGTEDIKQIKKEFVKITRECVKTFLFVHPLLTNYVDDRSKATIKWLKSMGAEVMDPEPYGTHNMLFRKFAFRRKQNV